MVEFITQNQPCIPRQQLQVRKEVAFLHLCQVLLGPALPGQTTKRKQQSNSTPQHLKMEKVFSWAQQLSSLSLQSFSQLMPCSQQQKAKLAIHQLENQNSNMAEESCASIEEIQHFTKILRKIDVTIVLRGNKYYQTPCEIKSHFSTS